MTELLTALKQSTEPYHKSLEKTLNILNPAMTESYYLAIVKAFWGYYQPLEATLADFDGLKVYVPDLQARFKLSLLETDLVALGVDKVEIAKIPVCIELPACIDIAQALGCLYVMEGATLGGQVISRHLFRLFEMEAKNGTAFFSGYGSANSSMWLIFRELLIASGADQKTVVQAACETFQTLEQWLLSLEERLSFE